MIRKPGGVRETRYLRQVGLNSLDVPVEEFGWPGMGWSTPLWAVLTAFFAVVAVPAWGLRRALRRRPVAA